MNFLKLFLLNVFGLRMRFVIRREGEFVRNRKDVRSCLD